MLTPAQLSDLKNKDPKGWELLSQLVSAINQSALQMGIDPKPASHVDVKTAIPPPRAPKSITVLVVSPVVFVTLEASPDATPSAFYFVEKSESPAFDVTTIYALGHGLHIAVPEPAGTTYWRAFAKYQMSDRSPFIAWEDQ